MAVTYPISVSNNIDKIIDTFATKIINGLYKIITLTSKFAGLIGVTVLSLILVLFMPLVYLYLSKTNESLKNKLKGVYNWINTASESDLRYAHLGVERRVNAYKGILSKNKILDKNIITMGVSSQANHLISQVLNLEETLKKAAYPNYEDQLSDDDINELLLVFEGAEID